MSKKISQSKRVMTSIDKSDNYNTRMQSFVLYLLDQQFGSLENFLKHLFCFQPIKNRIFSLLQQMFDSVSPEEKLKQTFETGVKHCTKIIEKHFRSISYRVRNLRDVTEDMYNAIRDAISYSGTDLLRFTSEITMPCLYR